MCAVFVESGGIDDGVGLDSVSSVGLPVAPLHRTFPALCLSSGPQLCYFILGNTRPLGKCFCHPFRERKWKLDL